MNDTPNLILPYILAAQSQKHVTHNEAIRALDALVQITALDRNLAAPPGSPADGDRYIVAASPTGAWAGQAGKIAAYQDAAWLFYAPKEGWIAWVADENLAVVYDGAGWTSLSAGGGGGGVTDHGLLTGLSDDDHAQYHNDARGDARYTPLNPTTLGINATADTTNRLALASAASLFSHAGTGGHQVKVNKAAASDTASFLFQTAFSGRAEMGTTGDDDFHFKVSADGTAFNEAILINRTTGVCTFPNTSFAGGETNTASNVGTAGTGVFKQKTGVNLEFKKINAGSAKVSITDDTANSEIDVDVVEASLTLANLGGSIDLSGAKASGILAAARFPALTGDATSTAGALATTIAANAVSNAKLADVPTATLKGRITAATGDPEDLTVAQAKTLLNLTGTNSGDQTITLTGDVTGTGTGSFAAAIAANAVTNAKLADMPTATVKGRVTAATGDPEDLTVAQLTGLLPDAVASGASHARGLVPTPGAAAGTTKFLREDMTWFTPAGGGGGSPGGADTQVQFNDAGAFLGNAGMTYNKTTQKLTLTSTDTLLNHAGAGRQVQVNKNAAGDTASFLFQTAFSGRAEMGTTGDDDFHFKVSADGTVFNEAIVIDRSTGAVKLPLTDNDVQVFDTAGAFNWTKPLWAKANTMVEVHMLGGGGGGGSGRRGVAATARCGGGGGGSATYSRMTVKASALGATVAGNAGAGGAGGAAQVTNATNGNPGTAGGASTFGTLRALGGNFGAGGTTNSGTAGAALGQTGPFGLAGLVGGVASTTGGAGGAGGAGVTSAAAGGGAGGGLTSANAASAGGVGGAVTSTFSTATATGGTLGAAGFSGGAGATCAFTLAVGMGSGGGGGGASNTAPGAGGAGGPGAGGGGGAAVLDGANSGAGGNGGTGWVVVVTHR